MSEAPAQPKPSARRGRQRLPDAWWAIAVCGFLVLAVLLGFGRTLSQGFLTFDDPIYIYDNPHVSAGLSWSGVAWAFTKGPAGDWCPLSMLSHMLDCQLYGLNPAGHHLTAVLLHAASAVLLFLVLWRMTGALWPSALVAALFALHPLRVESVAWLAERRDVLSGLLFMLTLGAYTEYVRRPNSLGRYLTMVGFFALSLLAKSIVVTLPALMLLLDYWPFGRFGGGPNSLVPDAQATPFPWRPIVDKLPLLVLVLLAVVMTLLTHTALSADPLTLPERLANAPISCVAYLGQLFVPVGLSPFYSHPEAGRPAWQVAAAVGLLLAITAAAVIGRRAYPYFFVGWFWYVGMLVPVLGLAHVGMHARADRYTYLSQIGLYIALVWGAKRLAASWPARRWIFGVGSAILLAALVDCTWRQTGYWHDDKTLWQHALACDPQSATAHFSLGTALERQDDRAAAAQYRQALAVGPNTQHIYNTIQVQAHCGLGSIALRQRDLAEAVAQYQQALELDPDFTIAHLNLGGLLASQGKLDEAIAHFRRSTELQPDSAPIYSSLALALALQGNIEDAITNYRHALAIDPNFAPAKQGLEQLSNR